MKKIFSKNLIHIGILGIMLFSISYFTNLYYLGESASCKNWDLQFKKESPMLGKLVLIMNELWGSKKGEASGGGEFFVDYAYRKLTVQSETPFEIKKNDFVVSVNNYPVDYSLVKQEEGKIYTLELGVIPLGDSLIKMEYKGGDHHVKQGLNCTYLPVRK